MLRSESPTEPSRTVCPYSSGVLPGAAISEEERIAQIDAVYEQKNKDKKKRSVKKAKERQLSLRERAKTDPDAAAEYEAFLERRREAGKKYRAEQKARKEATPEYQEQLRLIQLQRKRSLIEGYVRMNWQEKPMPNPEQSLQMLEKSLLLHQCKVSVEMSIFSGRIP